jgi:hypothetical protein
VRRAHGAVCALEPLHAAMLSTPCCPSPPSTQTPRRAPQSAALPGIRIAAEVEAALRRGTAVVALESTIISHGARMASCGMPWPLGSGASRFVAMAVVRVSVKCSKSCLKLTIVCASPNRPTPNQIRPQPTGMPYPQNLQTALEVEEVVRAGGAVPATIAIIAGECCVGEALWLGRGGAAPRRGGLLRQLAVLDPPHSKQCILHVGPPINHHQLHPNTPPQASPAPSSSTSPRPAPRCARSPAATSPWWWRCAPTAPPPSAPPCCWRRAPGSACL